MVAQSLLQSHLARLVAESRGDNQSDLGKLDPGQMKLYSYYKPGLMAEDYVIEVGQEVIATENTGKKQTIDISNTRSTSGAGVPDTQEFTVVVPRFSIDPAIINSYYPPDGHQDEGRILPHIVLNDPHYPWEIAAGSLANMDGPIDLQDFTTTTTTGTETVSKPRNMVPWVALLVFDVDELHLKTVAEAKALGLSGFDVDADLKKQSADGTFPMIVADYFNLPATAQIDYKAAFGDKDTDGYTRLVKSQDPLKVIFPSQALIRSVVGQQFPVKATTASSGSLNAESSPLPATNVEFFKYLAHVRHINTENCPDALVQQQGIFSIVLSGRTGPIGITQPKTQVCHLVSIECLDSTIPKWPVSSSDRIGLVSLFSWTYTALPPNPVNFVTTMRNLTEHQQMLRMEDSRIQSLDHSIGTGKPTPQSQVAQIMSARIKNGYTLSRWRTQTGEETAAFTRGPLVPRPVNEPTCQDLPDSSNTSQEYQILDPQTGLMDLSYSSAWQVGKLLAVSDTVFSAALMRFRSKVHNNAAQDTGMTLNEMPTRRQLLQSLHDTMSTVRSMSTGQTGIPVPVRPNNSTKAIVGLGTSEAASLLKKNIKDVVAFNTKAGDETFNNFNSDGPNNSDWVVVHSWLLEKLLLGGIPAQYLLPESAYLPRESLRFFFLDQFWLDCMIDGALSVANHLDKDDDVTRRQIKRMFNDYLQTPVSGANMRPQIPSNGFIIRSGIIKAMPDMKITINWQKPDARYPYCRWTKWDDETLMCLLDRPFEELESIILEQPTHQQRFSLGSGIAVDTQGNVTVNFEPRQLYTQNPPSGEWKNIGSLVANSWYDVPSRALKLRPMAVALNNMLQYKRDSDNVAKPDVDGRAYIDPMPNSCEFGLELNDPVYYFEISPPDGTPTFTSFPRKLYVKDPPSPSSSPAPSQHQGTVPASQDLREKVSTSVAGVKATVGIHKSQLSPRASALSPAHEQAKIQAAPSLRSPSHISIPSSPHSRTKIQPLPTPVEGLEHNKLIVSTSTLQTRFTLTVFPDYKGLPTRYAQDKYDPNDFIPTSNIYFFDLIFNIRKRPGAASSQYQLLKIMLDIPLLASATSKPTQESLLAADYDGPGLRMLSNQRFIPFLFNDKVDVPSTGAGTGTDASTNLHIELIPRSADDGYVIPLNDKRTEELGFRLGEPRISPVVVTTPVEIVGERKRLDRGKSTIRMTEVYSTQANPQGESVGSTYTIIKWDIQDDKEDG